MLKFQKVAMFLFLMTVSMTPMMVGAQYTDPRGNYGTWKPTQEENSVIELINKIIMWLLRGIAVLSLLFMIIGGVMYIISPGGDTETAKNMIYNAIIGLVIALLGLAIVYIVGSFLGGGTVQTISR